MLFRSVRAGEVQVEGIFDEVLDTVTEGCGSRVGSGASETGGGEDIVEFLKRRDAMVAGQRESPVASSP